MQIDAVSAAPSMWGVERAHGAINAAYNAIALDRAPSAVPRNVELARGYVEEARAELSPAAGHDGPDDAAIAARAVLPRLERALVLLDALGTTSDPQHVSPLLDELWIAMDHVEAALGAVGWD